MLSLFISLFSGIIFAIGLVVSGMINPEKVIGFLDLFGNWDFSLALVMAGAVGFNFFAFRFLITRTPLCSNEHFLPTKQDIDSKLILGSALFGIGWGILGICPGPGIVNLVTLKSSIFLFVGSMLAGMLLFKLYNRLSQSDK